MKLLTEPEAAEILRCSRERVKRLRLSGKLPYLPGRPVLIDEADLRAFIAEQEAQLIPPAIVPARVESAAAARKWALQSVLLRRQRG